MHHLHQFGTSRVLHSEGGEGMQIKEPDNWPSETVPPAVGNACSGSRHCISPSHAGTSAAESDPSSAQHRLPRSAHISHTSSCATKGSLQPQWPSGISAVFTTGNHLRHLYTPSSTGKSGLPELRHQGSSVKTCFGPGIPEPIAASRE